MSHQRRRAASPRSNPLGKKSRLTMDEAIAATQRHNDKVRADKLEVFNSNTSPLLRLPQEILDNIYYDVFDSQILQLFMTSEGRAGVYRTAYPHAFALPSTCRKLYQDTAQHPYTKTTFRILTFNFVSMLGTWRTAIDLDPNVLLDLLESVPAPWIENIEVIGVGVVETSYGVYTRDLRQVKGYEAGVDYKVEIEKIVRVLFPDAEITFRTVSRVHHQI